MGINGLDLVIDYEAERIGLGLRLSDVISATRYALWCLVRAVVDLWYLNPVYLVERRWRQLHPLNTRMALSVRPRLIDLATDFFLSDERRKRQLLSWVKSMLPWIGDEDLFDFTASWQDGIVLCALVETLSPGACPRFNLLKPHHRVNNCRLGITLAQKYLQVAQVPLSPEEMAIADEGCEVKICHLVQLLKWKYQKQGSKPTPFSSGSVEEPVPCKCYARGTGLRAGIVGRRTKFNILTDAVTRLSLQIEIMGPNNEYNKEKIVSMYAGSTSRYGGHVITTSASALLEDDGKTKVIEDGAGHSFIRQRSMEEETGYLVIPFDYQCVGEGRFL
ncbi:filamin-C, partial [Elysia marginata]